MRHFQMLIVSADRICEQCLQTASASGTLHPQTLTGASPLDPTGDFHFQTPWAIAPKMKVPAVATVGRALPETAADRLH